MKQYRLWVRVSLYQTTHTIITADNDMAAKQLGEAMFGKGNVLNYTRAS
ncbi:hypothetical protein [Novosphingobium arvoryzae]|nr:hypothetical protein [Novosphingobium arvoryzae]